MTPVMSKPASHEDDFAWMDLIDWTQADTDAAWTGAYDSAQETM